MGSLSVLGVPVNLTGGHMAILVLVIFLFFAALVITLWFYDCTPKGKRKVAEETNS